MERRQFANRQISSLGGDPLEFVHRRWNALAGLFRVVEAAASASAIAAELAGL